MNYKNGMNNLEEYNKINFKKINYTYFNKINYIELKRFS